MRLFSVTILVFFSLQVNAQRSAIKFYQTQDSIAYYEVDNAIRNVYTRAFTGEKGGAKLYSISHWQKEELDSLMAIRLSIPNVPFNIYQPDKNAIVFEKKMNKEELRSAEKLVFHNYHKKRLPLKLLKSKNLRELTLIGTNISKIPFWLTYRNEIGTLRVYNHRSKRALKFGSNKQTKLLVYRENVYAKSPKNIHKLKALEEIDFVNNDVQLPNWKIYKITGLKKLNISKNKMLIQHISNKPVPQLENLILTFNQLEEVPDEILLFPNLRDLQLAENQITYLNPKISELKNLEILCLYKNQLTELPNSIYSLENLEELDIYYNKIERIPEEIGQLKKLERLYLAENKLITVPESIGGLSNLKKLYIHHNRISSIPPSYAQLTEMTHFHINNNYFNYFPTEILAMKKMQDLDISHNDITELPVELLELENLELLWLHDNPLFTQEHTKSSAEALKKVIEGFLALGTRVQIE